MAEDGTLCFKWSTLRLHSVYNVVLQNNTCSQWYDVPYIYLFKAVLFKVFKPKDVQDSNPQGVA